MRRFFSLWIMLTACIAMQATYTIVLDPGHGGKDAGALGENIKEKNINLAVAKYLKECIEKEIKDAKVIMTRDDDFFVELQGRAEKANKSKADLFISIHCNSVDYKNPRRTSINGASVYTLGLNRASTNLEVAMRENSVIKLENDYSTSYAGFDPSSAESYIMFDLMQHANLDNSIQLAQQVQKELVHTAGRADLGIKQAPFWVLVRTSMPAILIELDFICNPDVEEFMSTMHGQQRLAQAICTGIRRYRGDKTVKNTPKYVPPPPTRKEVIPQSVPEPKKAQEQSDIVYKVQFASSPVKLADNDAKLKHVPNCECYQDDGRFKYTSRGFNSEKEAREELKLLKTNYPDAFIIRMQGDKRIK